MNRIINIIEQKKVLDDNNKIFYNINKRILWSTYVKPILKSYDKEELSYSKIQDFIYFLQLSKFKYSTLGYLIKYSIGEYFTTLNIEDSDYKLSINIYNKDKSIESEYIVKSSNTRYMYNIPINNNITYKSIYYVLSDNINTIINNTMYSLVKDYILR